MEMDTLRDTDHPARVKRTGGPRSSAAGMEIWETAIVIETREAAKDTETREAADVMEAMETAAVI